MSLAISQGSFGETLMSKSSLSASLAGLNRRSAVFGAGAAGALATAAAVLPQVADAPKLQALASQDVKDGGYQLTEHVKRYYATARI
jgi:hypothetical protein